VSLTVTWAAHPPASAPALVDECSAARARRDQQRELRHQLALSAPQDVVNPWQQRLIRNRRTQPPSHERFPSHPTTGVPTDLEGDLRPCPAECPQRHQAVRANQMTPMGAAGGQLPRSRSPAPRPASMAIALDRCPPCSSPPPLDPDAATQNAVVTKCRAGRCHSDPRQLPTKAGCDRVRHRSAHGRVGHRIRDSPAQTQAALPPSALAPAQQRSLHGADDSPDPCRACVAGRPAPSPVVTKGLDPARLNDHSPRRLQVVANAPVAVLQPQEPEAGSQGKAGDPLARMCSMSHCRSKRLFSNKQPRPWVSIPRHPLRGLTSCPGGRCSMPKRPYAWDYP